MGDFFRGWRRKIGLLSLVLALLFMGVWVRSLSVMDVINVRTSLRTAQMFVNKSL